MQLVKQNGVTIKVQRDGHGLVVVDYTNDGDNDFISMFDNCNCTLSLTLVDYIIIN